MSGQWHIGKVQNPYTGAITEDGNSPTKTAPSCAKQIQHTQMQPHSVIWHHAETLAESLKCSCINAGSVLWQDSNRASGSEAGNISAAAVDLHGSSSPSADTLKFFSSHPETLKPDQANLCS